MEKKSKEEQEAADELVLYDKLSGYLQNSYVPTSKAEKEKLDKIAHSHPTFEEFFRFYTYTTIRPSQLMSTLANSVDVITSLLYNKVGITDKDWDDTDKALQEKNKKAARQLNNKIVSLAKKVHEGKITQEEAIKQVQKLVVDDKSGKRD